MTKRMNKFVQFCAWFLPLLFALGCASVFGSDIPRKPKVRAITAFVRIDRSTYIKQIEDTLGMLRKAKSAFESGGFEVQTIRITTQPFPQYTRSITTAEAIELFKSMDGLSKKNAFLLNAGPALLNDQDDPAAVELLAGILVNTDINASLVIAGDDGIHWNAIRAAARTIKYVEDHSANGAHNFDFTAAAFVPPYTPFFPASNHNGPGHQFSIGLEGGSFVADVFTQTHGAPRAAGEQLSRQLAEHARSLEAIALQVEKDSGWNYAGLDATPAPNADSSIGVAIEQFIGTKFGSSGTLTAAAIITEAVRSIPVKRVGYSGLMLPPLEDPVLARGWSEKNYSMDSLLAYSAVCGTGLDAIPLPGDVSEQQLERIIGDVASLAFKWHKPLTARLIPAPGKKAGERTDFSFGIPGFPNVTLQDVP
jgi:uncharacterized protein